MKTIQDIFFSVIRSSIWGEPLDGAVPDGYDWSEVLRMFQEQALMGLVASTIMQLPESKKPQTLELQDLLLASYSLHMRTRDSIQKTIIQVFDVLEENGIKPILMKGESMVRFYPKNCQRGIGDIDLLVPQQRYHEAVKILQQLSGDKGHEDSMERHYKIVYNGFTLEIHQRPIWCANSAHKKDFQRLSQRYANPDCCEWIELQGKKVRTFPMQYNVLFIFNHLLEHLRDGGIGFKQIIDWTLMLASLTPNPPLKGRELEASPQPSPEGKGVGASPKSSLEGKDFEKDRSKFANKFGVHTADPAWYGILKSFAEENRNNPTEAESLLWNAIKNKGIGYKFRQQHIIEDFIVDFFCNEKNLTIELDGGYHNAPTQMKSDAERSARLKELGYTELRFTNDEVIGNLDSVLVQIRQALSSLQGRDGERLSKSLPLGGDLEEASAPSPLGEGWGEALENELDSSGLFRAWKVLGGIVVKNLGLPQAKFPFYDERLAEKSQGEILQRIIRGGNFGWKLHQQANTKHIAPVRIMKNVLFVIKDTRYLWTLFPAGALGSSWGIIKNSLLHHAGIEKENTVFEE